MNHEEDYKDKVSTILKDTAKKIAEARGDQGVFDTRSYDAGYDEGWAHRDQRLKSTPYQKASAHGHVIVAVRNLENYLLGTYEPPELGLAMSAGRPYVVVNKFAEPESVIAIAWAVCGGNSARLYALVEREEGAGWANFSHMEDYQLTEALRHVPKLVEVVKREQSRKDCERAWLGLAKDCESIQRALEEKE